ncbi:hypothetical protein PVA38_12070 [Streptococcus pneumoniae D39]|nr:hypothetical protein PVA38_12070 [Streptococcus pneumoniae D39]
MCIRDSPKPPVKGAKILLGRIGFIWRRLSFTHKVTARNIFRYKQRMLMTIFGVAGSVAVSYTHLRAHETVLDLVCRLLLEKKKNYFSALHIPYTYRLTPSLHAVHSLLWSVAQLE